MGEISRVHALVGPELAFSGVLHMLYRSCGGLLRGSRSTPQCCLPSDITQNAGDSVHLICTKIMT